MSKSDYDIDQLREYTEIRADDLANESMRLTGQLMYVNDALVELEEDSFKAKLYLDREKSRQAQDFRQNHRKYGFNSVTDALVKEWVTLHDEVKKRSLKMASVNKERDRLRAIKETLLAKKDCIKAMSYFSS